MNSIALNVENEKHFSSRIKKCFSRYQVSSILKQCNAYKKQGGPVVRIVRYLFTLVFLGRSMFLEAGSTFCLEADELSDISYAEAMERLQLFLAKLV